MSVLAHVILNGPMQREPAATQALAHILNSSPDIARAFVGVLRPAGADFEPGHVEAELAREDSRPDLTVHDSRGRVRAFVENKFWAGLTDAQPVSYFKHLPDDPPATLLFIVPRRRVTTVWEEIRLRCIGAGLEWEDAPGETAVARARVGGKAMAITSWAHVLQGLTDAARAGEHDDIRRDILQLQGLAGRMDEEAFLPLRGDEVTDQETARRLVNYSGLIEDIVNKLKDRGVADTKGLKPTHGWYTAGCYLHFHGRFGSWLGIDLRVWRDAGITPLWAWFNNGDFCGVAGHHQTIHGLFEGAQLDEDAGNLYIPIRLATGVERDRVIDDAAEQIEQLADTLRDRFSDGRSSASEQDR